MSNPDVSQARVDARHATRRRNRGSGRGRGSRNRPKAVNASHPRESRGTFEGDASQLQPGGPIAAPIAPEGSQSASSRTGAPSRGFAGRTRQLRGQRQPGRGGAACHDTTRLSGRRTFGGHLTGAGAPGNDFDDTSAMSALSLSGDAPEFVPGQPVISRKKSTRPTAPARPKPKPAKSTADDLGDRIHEDIANLNYECAICTDDVSRTCRVWSCTVCWTVVHLECVEKWYANQEASQALQLAQAQRAFAWRCPGCNSELSDGPGPYHCWCGKDVNPRPATSSLPPHSCGLTCSRPRTTCPHPCSTQCHAGPCPPCDLMGLPQCCFCGKNESRKLCRDTDYENGWSCQETCEDVFPCGEHFCSKPCHAGLCGECDVVVGAKCYCGQVDKMMACYEREEPRPSYSDAEKCWIEGVFSCDQLCQRKFDCGIHKCFKTCHPRGEQPARCPYSADSVTHCPCNKTPLAEILDKPRQSCEDAIPHCEKLCLKKLPCGHLCASKCHIGDCGFCNETVDIACTCGRTSSSSVCHQGQIERPMCTRICHANLNCGRHKCGEHCCPGERKAVERQAARKKHKLAGAATLIEAEHICIRTCGRQLKCGAHQCQQMCHRGPCASCPEAIFTEMSCNCGRTVLHPPQPCGTRVPECRFNCQRQPHCGHAAVEHNCHSDDVSCPKCPFLVEKWCACGKEKLHSQPCHLREAHCGKVCGKPLKCGLHNCKKTCHPAGKCEDSATTGAKCGQPCGKRRLLCGHSCQNNCHGQTLCDESSACTAKTIMSCPCGARQQQVKCLASSLNPSPFRPDMKCDDECLRLERNQRLAAALNIDPASHQNDHIPYADLTLRLFKENTSWAETQEREFRVFAKSPNETCIRFKPMMSMHRQFLHTLAEDYGLESKSEDVEPHRHVVVFKGSRFVSAPRKTLAQCVKIRATQAAEAASASSITSSRTSSPLPPQAEPSNGFLLINPRFGLTIDELTSALQSDLATHPSVHFEISFLPSEEILLRATTSYSAALSPTALSQALTSMKARLAQSIEATGLAGKIILCHVNSREPHIIRRDDLTKSDTLGWSAVARRSATRPESVPSGAEPVARTRRLLLGHKKKKQVEREESWTERLDRDVEC